MALSEYLLYRHYFYNKSMLYVIIWNGIVVLIICAICLFIIDFVLHLSYFKNIYGIDLFPDNKLVIIAFLIYSFTAHTVINLIMLFRRRVGRGLVNNLLFGAYIKPIPEHRAFMFVDMQSSTMIAERIGHLSYSSFIQDCFKDLSELLLEYDAQVYQFVGDEAVITWKVDSDFSRQKCITMYFAFIMALTKKKDYYEQNYGIQPHFKAALNEGLVVAAEVGEIKTEIAYHGEVLHIAARLQSLCKHYGYDLLLTSDIYSNLSDQETYKFTQVENIVLRGKTKGITVYGVTTK